MSIRLGGWALASTLVIAGVASALGVGAEAAAPTPAPVAAPPAPPTSPHAESGHGHGSAGTESLPPGHPPIGGDHGKSSMPKPADETPALSWKAPASWVEAENKSSFRLATYRIPRAGGDTEDAELAVSRAGGSAAANADRWVGQFDEAGKDERSERTVHGMKVTVVEVGGTYVAGASMRGGAAGRHPGQRLLGAIVETRGSSYFFKLVGPAATVRAARPAFDAMIAALAPLD